MIIHMQTSFWHSIENNASSHRETYYTRPKRLEKGCSNKISLLTVLHIFVIYTSWYAILADRAQWQEYWRGTDHTRRQLHLYRNSKFDHWKKCQYKTNYHLFALPLWGSRHQWMPELPSTTPDLCLLPWVCEAVRWGRKPRKYSIEKSDHACYHEYLERNDYALVL